jgi:PAS domain S-box-containing protein
MTETDIVGKNCYEVTHHLSSPCEPPNDIGPIKQILETGEPTTVEHIHYDVDGNPVYVEVSLSPVRDEDGNIIQVIHVSRDISERLRLTEEIKESEERLECARARASSLEELVEGKTGELLDAERMVTAGKIASMVGHDLRGPLQSINNALYLMKNTPLKTDEAQEIIGKAVQRAARMLEEIRSQTRDTPLSLVPTDLAALIKATVEEAHIAESVDVALEAGDSLMDVSLDPLQMRRVLDNLVGNAVDAMPDGGILRVAVERKVEEVVIEVSDTGVGISEDELSTLFKPFQSAKPGGLGLGLAFCKRAVEAHEGTITVDSKVGEGTTFTIKIPLR